MLTLKYFNNGDEVIAVYAQLGDKLKPEMAMALNRASTGFKSAAKKKIVAESFGKLKSADVDDWSFSRATTADLEAVEEIAGRRIDLKRFVPDLESTIGKPPKAGLTAHLPFLGTKTIKSGFAAALGTKKHVRAYTRDVKSEPLRRRIAKHKPKRDFYTRGAGDNEEKVWLKGRFPIVCMTFMAVPQMAEDEKVIEAGMEKAEINFFKQMDHRIDRLVKEF